RTTVQGQTESRATSHTDSRNIDVVLSGARVGGDRHAGIAVHQADADSDVVAIGLPIGQSVHASVGGNSYCRVAAYGAGRHREVIRTSAQGRIDGHIHLPIDFAEGDGYRVVTGDIRRRVAQIGGDADIERGPAAQVAGADRGVVITAAQIGVDVDGSALAAISQVHRHIIAAVFALA